MGPLPILPPSSFEWSLNRKSLLVWCTVQQNQRKPEGRRPFFFFFTPPLPFCLLLPALGGASSSSTSFEDSAPPFCPPKKFPLPPPSHYPFSIHTHNRKDGSAGEEEGRRATKGAADPKLPPSLLWPPPPSACGTERRSQLGIGCGKNRKARSPSNTHFHLRRRK